MSLPDRLVLDRPAEVTDHAVDRVMAARITGEHAAVGEDLQGRGRDRHLQRLVGVVPTPLAGNSDVAEWLRKNLEGCGHDYTQRTQRTIVQLHHVVAAHVLDHAAASAGKRAVGQRDADSDQKVAW